MKTYLTRQGLLVVREDASFYTGNDGTFRRLATDDEVEYLTNEVGLPLIEVDILFRSKLRHMEIPMWHYLWSISNNDYSHYKWRTGNNGGDYSFHEHVHFFTRCINGEWEIRTLTTYSTSAEFSYEFSYDEINGSFQSDLNILTVIGLKNKWHFLTRTSSGEEALDKLLDEGSWSMDTALQAAGRLIPGRGSVEGEYDYEIDKAELDRRCFILNAIGFEEPDAPRRQNGRKG